MLIKTKKLCMTFRNGRLETPVLFDVNLEIRRGEFIAIMGPSGCGKSTLMHILGLMLSPTSGEVYIDDCETTDLKKNDRARLRREKIGFVFQRFNLLPTLTAKQNIAIAERIRGHQLDGQISHALESVGMTDKADYKPGQLSIGQQQRIAIARAISHRPELILADEPTGNLDSANSERILQLFREVHQQSGVTVVMITHSPSAAQWADRIVRMTDGKILYD
jgi:putative ABC transport system ATP-binding protein